MIYYMLVVTKLSNQTETTTEASDLINGIKNILMQYIGITELTQYIKTK